MAEHQLLDALKSVRRRVLAIGVSAGAGWAMAAILALLMLFAWADLALDLAPQLRLTCFWISLPIGAALLGRAAMLALQGGTPRAVARRIDSIGNTGGQILSGVDLVEQYRGAVAAPTLSTQLAWMAVERASQLAARVRAAAAVPTNPLILPYASFGTLLIAVGVIALAAPRLLATQWARFTDPYGDHPPYSNIQWTVEPGNTHIIYGSALDVRATSQGGNVENAQLSFRSEGHDEESIPMFPEPGGSWRATVSQVTAGGTYFIRAAGSRTHKFSYEVITVPELRGVRARITPPAYTHLPAYTGPIPERGISGLPGTKVELWATSNRPLSSGTLDFVTTLTVPSASMTPLATGASEVTGSFAISQPGKLNLTIIDSALQPAREPYTTTITVLKDERPFVRILEPKENSFATPDAKLDVNISAEDDYGISSLQLFRGLNDTRATAANVPVPANQPTRLSASVPFDLSGYGLAPGDVIKFYARVEDNDPAGAKGSESPVVTLHIISNEEFNRMAVAREGLETLEARYTMANRLMEGFDDKLKKLQEELKKAPPDSPLAKEKQEEIKKLAQEMKDAAAEVHDAAKDELPFDIDKEFRKKLDDIAKSMKEAGEETDSVAKDGLPSGKAGDKLGAIRKKLGDKHDDFKKEVVQPLENLDKIFPLIEDQERFIEIWRRQQDLAERMKSVADAKKDDPKAKARMRDLETEQRQLVVDLNDLLNDIRDHAIRLPVVGRPLVRGDEADGQFLAAADGPANLLPLPVLTESFVGSAMRTMFSPTRDSVRSFVGSALRTRCLPTPDTVRSADPTQMIDWKLAITGEVILANIPNHDDDKELKDTLEDLQRTAFEFISNVRKSGAFEQMNESAADLGAFDGANAAVKAQEAADTLKKFIKECQGMSGKMRGLCVMVFRPNICNAMDSTIDQLLQAEGMNPGGGDGASGGFSQRRSSLRNSSLYGRVPMHARGGGKSGRNADGPGAGGNPNGGGDRDPGGQIDQTKLQAAGESDVAVPPEYKRKVGEYFQRVADELGQ